MATSEIAASAPPAIAAAPATEVLTIEDGEAVDPENFPPTIMLPEEDDYAEDDEALPQCKIKRNYLCTLCTYFTQNPRCYLYHVRDVHHEKMRIYECPHCLYASKHSQKLQRHVSMVHDPEKEKARQVRAERRAQKATKRELLRLERIEAQQREAKSHSRGHAEDDEEESDGLADDDSMDRLVIEDPVEPEPDDVSDEEPADVDTYQPGEDGAYHCSVCGFQSRSPTLVLRHERIVHLKKTFFRCRKCSYVTHIKARYTKHVKYHTMPLIKCSQCDFRTPYKWNLDRHLKNHNGTGNFRCAACSFSADIKQSLTVHEMNHHVPPVGGSGNGAVLRLVRRRNKVGGSECVDMTEEDAIDKAELELLRLERETVPEVSSSLAGGADGVSQGPIDAGAPVLPVALSASVPTPSASEAQSAVPLTPVTTTSTAAMTTDATARSKPLRCSQCNYRSAYISDMSRHLAMNHSKISRPATSAQSSATKAPSADVASASTSAAASPAKRTAKPLPNLIPIQAKTPCKPASVPEKVMTERDMNDICAKSCPTSSLRDFASVIGDESAFRTTDSNGEETQLPVDHTPYFDDDAAATDGETLTFTAISDKKRVGSFFDQLTEKLMPSTSTATADDPSSLVCVWCGHEAKCLSELVRHQKLHNGQTRGTSSSTRCQHCRHRCKSSADLVLHLNTCSKAVEARPGDGSGGGAKDEERDAHPMENKVFVWNNVAENAGSQGEEEEHEMPLDEPMETEDFPEIPEDDEADGDTAHDGETSQDGDGDSGDGAELTIPTADASLLCVETAPGYGSVTTQTDFDANVQAKILQTVTSVKKVFKCPHCSFWASTASRFHVHIVGHLNKKPFECSLCSYRSNWRWDITKHIRLKAARDPGHEVAKVLMTDETGRRNYSKYNKHLAFMKVAEPNAENLIPPGGRQSKAAANGLQGNVVSAPVEPVPILPAPPKLTRAPAPRSSVQVPQIVPGTMLRPPPPLQAATHLIILNTLPTAVRVQPPHLQASQLQGQQQNSQQPKPQVDEPQQKQQQKPKSVQQLQQSQAVKRPADEPSNSAESDAKRVNTDIKKTVWRCKQCHFRDGDRQVVLAHVKGHYRQNQEAAMRLAKLKNAGIVISPNKSEAKLQVKKPTPEPPSPAKKGEVLMCEMCPFVASSEASLQVHVGHHKMKADAIFKCYLCSYYVNNKADLVVHMSVHGVTNKEDFIEKTMVIKTVNTNGNDCAVKIDDFENPVGIFNGTDALPSQDCTAMDIDDGGASQPSAPDLDLSNLNETPVCWVLRNGNFVKMFKCRSCPHVNMRKSNISEHERMHGKRFFVTSNGAEISHNTSYQCSDCTYVCNNAGVLSSHSKVHSSDYPKAYGFVDPYRSDDAQLREISEKYRIPLEGTKDVRDVVKDGKLNGINIMSLLNPNQSITDAVLGMKKKFNLELDGEPFAEPQEDPSESPPSSPLKQLNEELDSSLAGRSDEKKLHFCQQCPARFLYRKELGIHARFHNLHLIHRCESCSYTARQRTHLQAHYKVHTDEYQERTKALLKMYKVNVDYPVPRTAALAEVQGMQGPVWIVVNALTKKISSEVNVPGLPQQHTQPALSSEHPSSSVPQQTSVPAQIEDENGKMKFCCSKCPATFFKPVALEYHTTLHGGSGPHKCRYCDYAVKTYGNLVKHMSMHGKKDPLSPKAPISKSNKSKSSVPISGTDLFQQRSEANNTFKLDHTLRGASQQVEKSNQDKEEGKENKKDELGHGRDKYINHNGSPDFVYPTYFKNGRLKEKRYKCPKCPSAFEKRDQYVVHLTLHGSNQRYACSKCDYSVKYYANYIQHMQKHKNSDAAKAINNDDDSKSSDRSESMDDDKCEEPFSSQSGNECTTFPRSPQRSIKTIGGRGERLSVADKQALMVMQQRHAKNAIVSQEIIDKNYWCLHCPYSNSRRDQVEVHMKKHMCVSGVRNTYTCEHCDYSGPSKHYLREHTKLHFDVSKTPRPDAYMVCEGLELYANTDSRKNKTTGKILIFQDTGSSSLSNRFLPPLTLDEEMKEDNDSPEHIQYINLNTLEPESKEAVDTPEGRNSPNDSDSGSEAQVETTPNSVAVGDIAEEGRSVSDIVPSDSSPNGNKYKVVSSSPTIPEVVNGVHSLDGSERLSKVPLKEELKEEVS